MENAPNDLAVFEHVVVVVAPSRWIAALEDQRRRHRSLPQSSSASRRTANAGLTPKSRCATARVSSRKRGLPTIEAPLRRPRFASDSIPVSIMTLPILLAGAKPTRRAKPHRLLHQRSRSEWARPAAGMGGGVGELRRAG